MVVGVGFTVYRDDIMVQRKWTLQLHFSKWPELGVTADIIWNGYKAPKDCPKD